MKTFVCAQGRKGEAGQQRERWGTELCVMTSPIDRNIVIRDESTGVEYEIDAESLVRAVKAAWEIVRPLVQDR